MTKNILSSGRKYERQKYQKERKNFSNNYIRFDTIACRLFYLEKTKENAREEAEMVALQFADAYFSGDIDGVKMHLSKSYSAETECYHPNAGESAGVEIMQVKGLQFIKIHNMRTSCHISVEFRAVYEDSLTYLEMDIVWEKSGWKIKSYGLEK